MRCRQLMDGCMYSTWFKKTTVTRCTVWTLNSVIILCTTRGSLHTTNCATPLITQVRVSAKYSRLVPFNSWGQWNNLKNTVKPRGVEILTDWELWVLQSKTKEGQQRHKLTGSEATDSDEQIFPRYCIALFQRFKKKKVMDYQNDLWHFRCLVPA